MSPGPGHKDRLVDQGQADGACRRACIGRRRKRTILCHSEGLNLARAAQKDVQVLSIAIGDGVDRRAANDRS